MGIIASILAASIPWSQFSLTDISTNDTQCTTVVLDSNTNAFDELAAKVDVLWTAHTNRVAMIEARRAEAVKRKSAIEQVRENAKKRKSRLGKSSGGVR